MVKKRNRTKPTATFEERLAEQARQFEEAANRLPDGSKAREVLLRRARQMETASRINKWLSSPELRRASAHENLPVDQKIRSPVLLTLGTLEGAAKGQRCDMAGTTHGLPLWTTISPSLRV